MPVQGGGGGGGGSAGAVRAGRAFVELFAKDNISGTLDKISAKMKRFGSILSGIGKGALAGGAALGAGPLALLFGGGSRLADTAKMAKQFEVPIQLMGQFQHAAEMAGVSVEEVMNDTKGRFSDLVSAAPLIDPAEAEAALQIQRQFKESIHALQDAMTPLLKEIAPVVTSIADFVKSVRKE